MEHCFSHLAYLGPGGPEFLLVMLVLLILFGAKDAPRILRKLNEIINQVRNTADGFKREVMYGDINSEPTTYEEADVEEVEDDYHYYDEEGNYTGDEPVEEEIVVHEDESVTKPKAADNDAPVNEVGDDEEPVEDVAGEQEEEKASDEGDDDRKV